MNIHNEKFRVHVLQGITGSGKTIVYFEALKNLIKKGFITADLSKNDIIYFRKKFKKITNKTN